LSFKAVLRKCAVNFYALRLAILDTSQGAVMLYGWEGNRMPGGK